jgi:TetR/AcrR family transcriptional regulator, transcriptional repressor for nem operon
MNDLNTTDLAVTRSPGRPRSFDTDAALDRAIIAFSERGYHAASIAELTAAMELTPGSVYKAFGDKKGVFLAAFDRYKAVRNALRDGSVGKGANGRDKLRRLLQFYADASCGEEGLRGCLVVGTATELAIADDDAAERVRRSMAATEAYVFDLIGEGREDGSIAPSIDGRATARLMVSILQGMRLVGKAGRSREEMTSMVEAAMRLFD